MLSLNNELFDILKKNNLKEETDEEEEIFDDSFCTVCNENSITNMKGQLVCTSCGHINGYNIDNTAEWRFYGSEDSKGSDPNLSLIHI